MSDQNNKIGTVSAQPFHAQEIVKMLFYIILGMDLSLGYCPWQDLRFCLSKGLPNEADTAGPQTVL